jgi:16S rRNA (guanine1207-N2)-methyltransferase
MPGDPTEEAEPDHYFTERPRSPSARRELRFLYRGSLLAFEVDRGVFAGSGLDPGTAILIEALEPADADHVLDLGCGWGPIGIAAAKAAPNGHVMMTDINRRAVALARSNLRRNRIANAEVRAGAGYVPVEGMRFDLIATNPPYHAGRELVLGFLEGAPAHLTPNGRLLIVGKGSQGIRYYQSWLEEHWRGPVEVLARGGGYRAVQARP